MPTTRTNAYGTFVAGLTDPFTGEDARYKKVSKWVDGSQISAARCDGDIFVQRGPDFYKRKGFTRVNVENLGLLGEGERIEDLINEKLRTLSPWTEFFFPEGDYVIGPSANKNLSDVFVGLSWGTSGACFTGSGRGTNFILLDGCVGFQLDGGLVKGVPVLRDFNLRGPGRESSPDGKVTNVGPWLSDGNTPNPDAGRMMGDWSRDPNKYQYTGINAWCQAIISGVNVESCAGHGAFIQGFVGLKAKGPVSQASGTFINSNRFRLDNPGLAGDFSFGIKVQLGGATGFVGGIESNGDISLDVTQDGNVPFPASGHYTVSNYKLGGDLIADNGVIQGNCNFDFNAGAGVFFLGSDGNQWAVFGCSARENGLEGFLDSSFLGIGYYNTHVSANGRHINKYEIDGIIGNDLLLVGGYRTTDVNAFSTYFMCYSEGGNQGPLIAPYRTMVVGGTHETGITGGCFEQRGVDANMLKVGDIILSRANNEIIFKYGDLDEQPLRWRRYGPGKGKWGYGIINSDGSTFFDIWSMALPGATIPDGEGGMREVLDAGATQYAYHLGPKKIRWALTLLGYLGNGGTKRDRPGDILEVTKASGENGVGPMRYKCVTGGTSPEYKPEYMPDDYGRGTAAQRPVKLLAMDAGWPYLATDTKVRSYWDGGNWAPQ